MREKSFLSHSHTASDVSSRGIYESLIYMPGRRRPLRLKSDVCRPEMEYYVLLYIPTFFLDSSFRPFFDQLRPKFQIVFPIIMFHL